MDILNLREAAESAMIRREFLVDAGKAAIAVPLLGGVALAGDNVLCVFRARELWFDGVLYAWLVMPTAAAARDRLCADGSAWRFDRLLAETVLVTPTLASMTPLGKIGFRFVSSMEIMERGWSVADMDKRLCSSVLSDDCPRSWS